MTMNDKINELRRQIEIEETKIRNCNHDFGVAYYNPTTERKPYGYRIVAQGSDVWGESEGYRDVKVDRWTRKCKLCGFEQHTDKQKPIISGYEPNF